MTSHSKGVFDDLNALSKHVKFVDDSEWDRGVYQCKECEGFGFFLVEAKGNDFLTLGGGAVPEGEAVYVLCKQCQEPRTWKIRTSDLPFFWPREYRTNLLASGYRIVFPCVLDPKPTREDHKAKAANDDSINDDSIPF